jgi:hypothetical protein
MLVGQHPDVMTAGALKRFPNGKQYSPTNLCTCGSHPNQCSLWSAVLSRVGTKPGEDDADLNELYTAISDLSNQPVVLDCTHNADRLVEVCQDLASGNQHSLRVILIKRTAVEIADIQVRTALRKNRIKDGILARSKVITRGVLIRREILRELRRLSPRVTILTVDYHDLCRDPITGLTSIWTQLGLDPSRVNFNFKDDMLCIEKPAHMIHGNSRLRAQHSIRLQAHGYRLSHLRKYEQVYASLLNVVSSMIALPSVRSMRRFLGHPR